MMTEMEKQTPICSHSLSPFLLFSRKQMHIHSQGDTFITRLSLGETDVTCMSLQREVKGEPRGES